MILAVDAAVDDLCLEQEFTTWLWRNEKYAERSEEVHRVLGLLIICSLAAWTPAVVPDLIFLLFRGKKDSAEERRDKGLLLAQRIAGCLGIVTGFYLLVWVLFLLRPSQVRALRQFAWRDLVQRQHLALAANLILSGLSELQGNIFFVFVNTVSAGLLFLSHPQRTLYLSAQHFAIGTSLIFGAAFLAAEKILQFRPALTAWSQPSFSTAVHSPLVYAIFFFILAASILIHFKEMYPHGTLATGLHTGIEAKCHHGKFAALFAFCLAFVTILTLLLQPFFIDFPNKSPQHFHLIPAENSHVHHDDGKSDLSSLCSHSSRSSLSCLSRRCHILENYRESYSSSALLGSGLESDGCRRPKRAFSLDREGEDNLLP